MSERKLTPDEMARLAESLKPFTDVMEQIAMAYAQAMKELVKWFEQINRKNM